jgi:hypothetical protein
MKLLFVLFFVSTLAYAQGFQASGNSNEQKAQGLTDEETNIKDNFIHEGKSVREFNEACGNGASAEQQKMCDGKETKKGMLGLDPGMVGMVSKMYVMVMGMGGVGGTFELKQAPVAEGKTETPKTKDEKETSIVALFLWHQRPSQCLNNNQIKQI